MTSNSVYTPERAHQTSGTWKVVSTAIGFAGRAVCRRVLLVVLAFLLTFSLIVVAVMLVPRSYRIEVKLLAQRSVVMQSLSNPGRAVPYDADAPTKSAAETVLRRDNLISLIRHTNLLEAWDRTRSPVLGLYDRLTALVRRREPTIDDKLDNLITELERRIYVATAETADGVVTITLVWPDAHTGYLIVEHAQRAFLDARQVAETQSIAEAVKVLESHAANLQAEVQETLGKLDSSQAQVLLDAGILAARSPASRSVSPVSLVAQALDTPDPLRSVSVFDDSSVDLGTLTDPRLGRLKAAVGGKRAELTQQENEQKRRLDQLEAQLAAARAVYTPNHPTVQSLQQSLTALQHNSPQVTYLRNELDRMENEADDLAAQAAERLIRAELERRGSAPQPRRQPPSRAPATLGMAQAPSPEITVSRPKTVAEFETLSLRTQLRQLQSVLERTDATRIELEVSRAAFKHRYSVVSPAEEPKEPEFPDSGRVLLAGLIASVVFALVAAVAADGLSSRVLESWQVEHYLGLPVLARVRLS